MAGQDLHAVFGQALGPDPQICLDAARIDLPPPPTGPAHRAQYVVELVGPRTIPAAAVHELLRPPLAGRLGQPDIWVMAAADTHWRRPLPADAAYDSVACAWNLVAPSGALSTQSATHLLQGLEAFANAHGRRALPMPVPADIPSAIRAMGALRERYDAGLELGIIPRAVPMPERDIWITCAALGFDLGPEGGFEWRIAGWPAPILTVASWDEPYPFSLGSVVGGRSHTAIGVGFSIPLSPRPVAAFEVAVHVARILAQRLDAVPVDDEERPLQESSVTRMRQTVAIAESALNREGCPPGSASAFALFGGGPPL